MEVLLGRGVSKLDTCSRSEKLQRSVEPIETWIAVLSTVEHEPFVIVISVGVECDLLLLATSGVVVRVRVEVPALGVEVAKGDL